MARPARCAGWSTQIVRQRRVRRLKRPRGAHNMANMPVETEISAANYVPVKAPRGTAISCRGWQQEAAMRMLMNNLDEEVGERPRDLVVYGGTGRAARSWECYHAIVRSLRELAAD